MQQHRPHKSRAILTEQQAIDIFRSGSANSISTMVSSATYVAKQYGINERTVRDIWKQRTWTNATSSLAEVAGPMTKRKMGRPIGSKDVRPRKQKLAAGTLISSNLSNPCTAANPADARQRHYISRPNSESRDSSTYSDQVQQGSVARRRLFTYLLSGSFDQAALLDRSPVEDERQAEEASIDDQLHAWAHCGSQWIIDPALSLHGEAPPDGAPAVG